MSDSREQADSSRPVTISSIAASAGVSAPTVSKVLNGRSGVSAGTRARVEALIDEHGYRKSSATGRGAVVDLVFDEPADMWGVEIIRGVQRVARRHGVGLVLSEFGPRGSSVRCWVDDALDRRPACVVTVAQLSAEERDRLRARGIPFVVFDPTGELPDDVPFVGATNWSGGRAATRHLTGLGHRRIGVLTGQDDLLFCRARLDGHRSALEDAGIAADPALVARAPLTRDGGFAATRALLALPEPPTALFACNDLQALGAYRAAREAGLRVPEDLSVVGFDDLPVGDLVDPPLTTVRQPLAEMAAAAAELALALGRGERPPQLGVELATTLTVRRSTAPPRA
ncbi:LacI family DNA-binding transcriptional regulator [Actinosynnema pretiosum]|uniref:LacI family transcriptional regulator n=1 Tax=Actinosynnema pretiosum TaxID=42197 RepID=A0A290Z6V4_9PSEU|nr:LacI family DNA-binding transcriptional regulator [Actinosynnema pretiosum]ATE54724.1 LacI family transcriptional regulator [Actinosynnema pretiosum]